MSLHLQETLMNLDTLRAQVKEAEQKGKKVTLTEASLDLVEKMARNIHGDFSKGRASIQEAISSTDTVKLIPKVITNALNDIKIPVYGNGQQIRNWIYVDDHNDAILKIIENGKIGEIYNIGSNTLIPNIDVIKTILKILNKSESLIDYVTDRPGHDFAYHLNSEKIQNDLNWKECHKFEDALIKTVEWYKSFYI